MASGDSLQHRGRLTRLLVAQLVAWLDRIPAIQVSDLSVAFLDSDGSDLATMSLVAAWQSLSFDVATYNNEDRSWDWSSARSLSLKPYAYYEIRRIK